MWHEDFTVYAYDDFQFSWLGPDDLSFGRTHGNRGSTVRILLLQRFRISLIWVLVLFHQSVMNLDLYVGLIHWWVEILHADRTTSMCIWTTAEPRVRLLQRKTGLSRSVIYYWPFQGDASVVIYSNCQCSSVFCLSLTYCLIFLGEASGQLLEKGLSPWLFACAVFILVQSQLYVSLSRLVFRPGCGL